jgi:hypothetical protein
MARIIIEDYKPNLNGHRNPMGYVDNAQRGRYSRAPSLMPYKVCLVNVCDFTFEFHSVPQLKLCLEYYLAERHPSSRLPVYTENLGGDHWETQRWFEKLPQYLLEKPKRTKVVAAFTKALKEYALCPGSETGVQVGPNARW